MADVVAQKHQDYLPTLKKNVERSFVDFKHNIERFHKFQKFAFQTAISKEEEAGLTETGKPIIEFNLTNAPLSRLCGEFSKQEPSIYVSNEEGDTVDPETIEVVEGHLRHILFESKKHNTQYNVYRDTLTGGFSQFKVWTEYANEMSFDQIIKFGRTFDPTLVGFDPMAREVDKSDAEFCFEIFPKSKEDFKAEYPNVDLDKINFQKQSNDFNWSYSLPNGQDIIILCQYYLKKKRRLKIVKTAENKVMSMDDYQEFLDEWEKSGMTHQPPAIVGKPRWTERVYICRYVAMQSEIVEYEETDFKYQPIVFADGDSVILKNIDGVIDGCDLKQFCKPYIYHTAGIQKLTNLAGQVIGNDFENMVMHKFIVAEESLPSEAAFRTAYTKWQKPSTLIYKSLWNNDPSMQLPPPREIARVPLPQEVITTFNSSMQMLQNILGSYDAALGINDNQLSGMAIVEGATQSNAAAMPYVVNYMQALNQVANIIVDLIPKYYKTPRTIPIVDKEGKRSSVNINQPNGQGIQFNYDENSLQVKVEAGVNFAIAKNKALQQIIALMQASPEFADFMNDQGLETLLDNIEFRNVDVLRGKVQAWLKKKESKPNPEQMQAEAQMAEAKHGAQMAETKMQMDFTIEQKQLQLAEQKMAQEADKARADAMIKSEQIIIDRAKVDNERMEILQKAGDSEVKLESAMAKAKAEETRALADIEMKHADMHLDAHNQGHSQAMDTLKHQLEIDKHEHEKTIKPAEPKE